MSWFSRNIFKFWGVLTFAEKVALLASLMGFLVITMSMILAGVGYRADKEAYLYELQMLRARSAAMDFQGAVALSKAHSNQIAPGTQLPEAQALGLNRLPENDEAFVIPSQNLKNYPIGKNPTATAFTLFRSSNGSLMAAPFITKELPAEDGSVFISTNEGTVIASSDKNILTTGNISARPSVRMALKSNLTESTTAYEVGKQRFVVAYMEIPKTNLLVFAEVSLRHLMAPFYEAMRLGLVFGFLIIMTGMVLSFLAVKKVAQPARLATEHLLRMAQGDFTTKTSYSGSDEFKTIFNGIDYLAENIALREERLNLVGEGLKGILTQTSQFDEQLPVTELALGCATIMKTILSKYLPTAFGVTINAEIIFFHADSLQILAEAPPLREQEHAIEIPVYSNTKEPLLTLSIYGVRATNIWPETMQTIAQFSQAITSYFERRAASAIRNTQMRQETELAIAGTIQKSLVMFPKMVPNAEIAERYTPAERLGGDWTSAYFDSDTRTLRFFMADATGHGIAPSLVTAVVAGATRQFQSTVLRNQIEILAQEEELLQDLARQLNTIVLEVGAEQIGMTMIMGSLNCDSGELALLNLGHPRPMLFGVGSELPGAMPTPVSNNPLGSEQLATVHVQTITLSAGQGILLFTDGLLENYSSKFKSRELKKIAIATTSAAEMVESTMNYYSTLAQENENPEDDVAVLAVQWLGA